MLKGKNLLIALGVGAVAYYLFMQNKKNKAAKVISAPAAASNFTGDLGVPEYQNGIGIVPISDRQFRRRERQRRRQAQ
jgi:hypothetical protein